MKTATRNVWHLSTTNNRRKGCQRIFPLPLGQTLPLSGKAVEQPRLFPRPPLHSSRCCHNNRHRDYFASPCVRCRLARCRRCCLVLLLCPIQSHFARTHPSHHRVEGTSQRTGVRPKKRIALAGAMRHGADRSHVRRSLRYNHYPLFRSAPLPCHHFPTAPSPQTSLFPKERTVWCRTLHA